MSWTYNGNPGTGSAAARKDAVRLFVGDTDTDDQLVTDEEIAYFLSEVNDNVRRAAAMAADAIASKFASLVDVDFDKAGMAYSKLSAAYSKTASRLRREARQFGGLGVEATGISQSDMDTREKDTDRLTPAFRRHMFANPPGDDPETRADYHE